MNGLLVSCPLTLLALTLPRQHSLVSMTEPNLPDVPTPPSEGWRGAKLFGRSTPLGAVLGAMAPPLDLRILGRTLLHTATVGLAAGLVGAAFFAALEYAQSFFLEHLAGYTPLRAHGERIFGEGSGPSVLRPVVVLLLPMAGALLAGIVCQLAPETRGGGGDATIHAFHHQGGVVRRRVIWVKAIASILTLGSGGSGGREGPTMQMGGAIGSAIGRALKVNPRERRILMVAGVAAGMAAVFRTPLGAALLAAEILYRDDFEAEALIPAIMASVIAYSVVISIFGESTLFARAPRYLFIPKHLPLYALLAIMIAAVASIFLAALRGVQRLSARSPLPPWARPAAGGLALGIFAVPLIILVGGHFATPGRALGVLGGGYGAAQVAITGADWLPGGWKGAEFLLFLCGAKLLATSLTVGTGGSAGDFGPSLVLGGLFGGAFGRAAAVLLHDPSIDPGAFALVGMGTFYGGLAHVPVSSLIMVSELAGSYDLLVPLMLAEGIAFVALRRRFLYDAQVPDLQRFSGAPAFQLAGGDRQATGRGGSPQTNAHSHLPPRDRDVRDARRPDGGDLADHLPGPRFQRTASRRRERGLDRPHGTPSMASKLPWSPPICCSRRTVLHLDDDLRKAGELLLGSGLHQLPVLTADGKVAGFIDESHVTRAYLTSTDEPDRPAE